VKSTCVTSRTEAKKRITLKEYREATLGVECRKDSDVIDESPAAYKSIEDVMAAQSDLVEIMFTLKQIVCVSNLLGLPRRYCLGYACMNALYARRIKRGFGQIACD